MVILTLTEKGGEPKQLTFEKDEVTVGRVQGNDIVLPKGNVSKRHCRIFIREGGFSVEDLKSTNGTYVNGRKIVEATVLGGADKVYVGDFIIKIDNAPGTGAVSIPPANEAGSLSTALPRRAPPPPPRPTGAFRAVDGEASEPPPSRAPTGRMTLPPPPPPPKRDSKVMSVFEEPPPAPPEPGDIAMDDEPLDPRPKLNVPPLKSMLASLDDDYDPPHEEPKTANKDRGVLPPPPAGSADDLATWMRTLTESSGVTALFVSGTTVEVERNGRRESVASLDGETPLDEAIRAWAARGTPRPVRDAGILDVGLGGGWRLTALLRPAATSPHLAVQRTAGAGRNLPELVASEALSREGQEILESALAARRNVVVAGEGMASRLALQAIATALPVGYRAIAAAPGVEPESGSSWTALDGVPNADVLAAAAALRPDYLVLDFSSGVDPAGAFRQAAVAPSATILALSAGSATDALARLRAFAGQALGGGSAGRELVASYVDLVVSAVQLADGSVRFAEISEPRLDRDGQLRAEPLVSWKSDGMGTERFQASGTPSRLAEALAVRGLAVPASLRR